MDYTWTDKKHLPSYGIIEDFIIAHSGHFIVDFEKEGRMVAVECIRDMYYPDLTYVSYLMAVTLTGSMTLDPNYQAAKTFYLLKGAQAHFEEMMVAITAIGPAEGPPMDRSKIPSRMAAVVDLIDKINAEEEVGDEAKVGDEEEVSDDFEFEEGEAKVGDDFEEEVDHPAEVLFELDQEYARKMKTSPLVINLLRNSGLAVHGSFAHYCMVEAYLYAAMNLQSMVNIVLDQDSMPSFD